MGSVQTSLLAFDTAECQAGRRWLEGYDGRRGLCRTDAEALVESLNSMPTGKGMWLRCLEIDKKAQSAEISERALDLRGLLDAVALTERGICAGDALELCVINKTFDSYERTLVRDVIDARIPRGLTRDEIMGCMDPADYIGCCPEQVDRFLDHWIRPVLEKYADALGGEGAEIKV